MRFSQRTRRWAMRFAWAGLLVAVALLVGLRLGRPLYYTDGHDEIAAGTLTASGMLRWNSPEVLAELPGPVQGRVAQLADGRLVYGRSTPDGTTDLVVFDPRLPQAAPEPVYGLNTPHNELAPAIAADGRLYFASDRPEGVGGYDLYVAPPTAQGFGAPAPVALCNTVLDETDPAPHPDGREFVFVRIDRRLADGHGGELWRADLSSGLDPLRVFAERPARAAATVEDRDPAFAAAGNALWFVRAESGRAPMLQRSSRLGERIAAPEHVGAGWGIHGLRAPMPAVDGLRLGLLSPRGADRDADLWFGASAEELTPWWPGQRWLEQLLCAAAAVCALLLVLLHLGQRWSALDLVAQCLLLSLLLHLLLFLWLMGVEIEGSAPPGDDDQGRLQVHLVATQGMPSAGGGGPAASDVAARVAFAAEARRLAVTAPTAAPNEVLRDRALAEPTGDGLADAVAGAIDVSPVLADRAVPWDRRSDRATEVQPAAIPLPVVMPVAHAAAAAQAAAREDAASEVLAVSVPQVEVPERAPSRHLPTAATRVPLARETAVALPPTPLVDAATAPTARAADESSVPVVAAMVAVGTGAPLAPAPARGERSGVAPLAAAVSLGPLPARGAAPAAPVAPPAALARAARSEVPTTAVRDAGPVGATLAAAAPLRAVAAAATAVTDAQAPRVVTERSRAASRSAAAVPLPAVSVPRRSGAVAAAPAAVPASRADERVAAAAPAPTTLRDRAVVGVPDRPGTGGGPLVARPTPTAARREAVAEAARGLVRADRAERVLPPGSQLERPHARRVVAGRPVAAAPVAAGLGHGHAPQALHDTAAVAAPMPPGRGHAPLAAVAARVGASLPAAPRRTAGHTVATRPGTQPPELEVEPPASQLARAEGMRAGAVRGVRAAAPPKPRTAQHVTAVADLPPPTRADPAAAPVQPLAAATVTVSPQPPLWPRAQRPRPRRGATELPLAAAKPGSRLPLGTSTAVAAPQPPPEAPTTAYSNRFGPAKARALETFGGNEATERAVADGLRYLARVQNADGTWGDRADFDAKYGHVYVGKTALCVLAFLGAGHTPESRSEHSTTVRKALDHLLSIQDPYSGAFGASSSYGHGIATYALAETYGLCKNRSLLRPLEDALAWILRHQGPRQDRRNRGGWGYFSPGLEAEDDYARVSVTAWMVMALESARLSGIELPEGVLPRAREYLTASFDQRNGWFRYNHEPGRLRSAWPTLPASTPAGAFCLLLLGAAPDDHMVQAAVDFTVQRRPEEYRRYDDDAFVLRGQGNVYFWYYGSLCCFLAGGEAWDRWNERLRTVLPAAQSPDGSFAPIDVYAREAGDDRNDHSYTTAMCVLSLEVYYRYFTPLLLGR